MDDFIQIKQKADRLNAITQCIGFTLWQLQELEGVAAKAFVLLAQASKGMGISAGKGLLDKAQAKTFGATIYQMVKFGILTPDLDARFKLLLKERNWLVHNSRATSRNAIHHDSAMNKLLSRVEAIQAESKVLMYELSNITMKFVTTQGISQQDINQSADLILKQWHKDDNS